ncbi:MAG: glycosyltransferase family 2 protein [Anaerolineales bacterium]|nr:glycosyltransferase family 2 protein [Anaerolineales bacterium]
MADETVKQPLVISVILNTNRRDDTLACLASLEKSSYSNLQTIVLDNASIDGSLDAINRRFPDVTVIPLQENKGYAGNNNVGIQAALELGADWVLVLNEDTIVDEECISKLIQVGEVNSKIGIVGPMVYHYDEPVGIQSAGGWLNSRWESGHIGLNEADNGQFKQPHPVEWISGCAILVRRAVIHQIGMLDERFFYYWEETEWCLRYRRAGWTIMHVPYAKLWHKGVQRDYKPNPNVTYYNTRNRLMFMKKHGAPLSAWGYTWYQLVRTYVTWSLLPKWADMVDHRAAMGQAILDFLRNRWGMRHGIH